MDHKELFRSGISMLENGKPGVALRLFQQAMEAHDLEPLYVSYAGYCMALEGRFREGVALCEKAVRMDYGNPTLYLNLGRAYMLSGNKRKAYETFWKGYDLDTEDAELKYELDKMGFRRPPVFKSLKRGHWLNKFTGKLLYLLRLR